MQWIEQSNEQKSKDLKTFPILRIKIIYLQFYQSQQPFGSTLGFDLPTCMVCVTGLTVAVVFLVFIIYSRKKYQTTLFFFSFETSSTRYDIAAYMLMFILADISNQRRKLLFLTNSSINDWSLTRSSFSRSHWKMSSFQIILLMKTRFSLLCFLRVTMVLNFHHQILISYRNHFSISEHSMSMWMDEWHQKQQDNRQHFYRNFDWHFQNVLVQQYPKANGFIWGLNRSFSLQTQICTRTIVESSYLIFFNAISVPIWIWEEKFLKKRRNSIEVILTVLL